LAYKFVYLCRFKINLMRNKENKRPSAGKGSAGRGRSAGTGKPAFRDSSAPKRGRPAGKPSFSRNTGEEKEKNDSLYTRRNKPFSTGKDSSAYSPRERSGGRPSEKGDAFRTSSTGPSKYPRSDGDSPRGHGERRYDRKDSEGSSDKGPSKYIRKDKPFSSERDNSSRHSIGDRPFRRPDSARSEDSGQKKYVRKEKPFSSDKDSSFSRERSVRPYERKDSTGSFDKGPSKYIRKDKPFSSDRDSSAPHERSERPYERKDSHRSEDSGPQKYVRRDKTFSSDRDSTSHERSDRPYERKDSTGAEDSGPKKYVRRDKPFSSDRDSSAPRERSVKPYEHRESTRSEDGSPKKYVRRDKPYSSDKDSSAPRRDRPLAEPRKPILDLREEKLKASGDWKEETAGEGITERSDRQKTTMPKYARRTESETIRLNKFIANAGICSRREADELIRAGVIKVNGITVTEMGLRVGPRDKVQYGDQTLVGEKMVYVLLNKPKGYLTTSEDPFDRKTVMELVSDACRERIYPVGRLDRNTTGLLLLTNDGDIAKKLTHPRHKVKKIYHVELDKALTKSDMIRISDGVELDDGIIKADEIAYTGEGKKEIGIELHSGKNRVVRRIFELLEYDVVKLDRVSFAGLTKKDLPRGRWRYLTESEVNYLKMLR
jgi:23S rRNA pseudouridine2605 synthase